jgi:uncharacterized protein
MLHRAAFPGGSTQAVPVGIGGASHGGYPDGVIFYVCVDDLRATLNDIERLGGSIVTPPAQAAENGVRVALARDPEGHLVGLVESGSVDPR